MSQSQFLACSVVLYEFLDFFSPARHLQCDHTFRRLSPGRDHNFFAIGYFNGTRQGLTDDDVDSQGQKEVQNKGSLFQEGVDDSSCNKGYSEYMHTDKNIIGLNSTNYII